jgi:hypothetical protein
MTQPVEFCDCADCVAHARDPKPTAASVCRESQVDADSRRATNEHPLCSCGAAAK